MYYVIFFGGVPSALGKQGFYYRCQGQHRDIILHVSFLLSSSTSLPLCSSCSFWHLPHPSSSSSVEGVWPVHDHGGGTWRDRRGRLRHLSDPGTSPIVFLHVWPEPLSSASLSPVSLCAFLAKSSSCRHGSAPPGSFCSSPVPADSPRHSPLLVLTSAAALRAKMIQHLQAL